MSSKKDIRSVCRLSARGVIASLLACLMLVTAVPGFAGKPKPIDPDAVKTKVEKLGVGEHVMVKRRASGTLHGNITEIGSETFTVRPDNTQSPVQIHYAEVLKVRKNPGPITWMILGAVVVIIIIIAAK